MTTCWHCAPSSSISCPAVGVTERSDMAAKKDTADRVMLPLEEWPAADRQAWQAAQKKGGVFNKSGWAAHWSEAATKTYVTRNGRWLRYVLTVHPETAGMHPADRVSPERLGGYLTYLDAAELSEVSCHAMVRSLLTGMQGIAP